MRRKPSVLLILDLRSCGGAGAARHGALVVANRQLADAARSARIHREPTAGHSAGHRAATGAAHAWGWPARASLSGLAGARAARRADGRRTGLGARRRCRRSAGVGHRNVGHGSDRRRRRSGRIASASSATAAGTNQAGRPGSASVKACSRRATVSPTRTRVARAGRRHHRGNDRHPRERGVGRRAAVHSAARCGGARRSPPVEVHADAAERHRGAGDHDGDGQLPAVTVTLTYNTEHTEHAEFSWQEIHPRTLCAPRALC